MAFLTPRDEGECDALRWNKLRVLDQGEVALVDWMGSDQSIVQGARISYGLTQEKQKNDREVLRLLLRHWHTSPFELACVQLYIRAPMDVWRQLIRHRTGAATFCSVNEYSTRYKEAIDARQETEPDDWRLQATDNKQGSSGCIEDKEVGEFLSKRERELHTLAMEVYQERLKAGVAREQARKDLPLSTYTEAIVRFDLHNLLHFLRLRMDSHAQLEIREYAERISYLVKRLFPETHSAWEDYVLNAKTFSKQECVLFRFVMDSSYINEGYPLTADDIRNVAKHSQVELTQREINEFISKLVDMGISTEYPPKPPKADDLPPAG